MAKMMGFSMSVFDQVGSKNHPQAIYPPSRRLGRKAGEGDL